MNEYLHASIAMLAVINPFVCGAMMIQIVQGKDKKDKIYDSIKAMLIVLIILLAASLVGKSILNALGISMDALKVVGGIVISVIGFRMLRGPHENVNEKKRHKSLISLIMFAASPATISMVITLAATRNHGNFPMAAIVGTTLAVLLTLVVLIAMTLSSGNTKKKRKGLFSKLIGLVIMAMGLQFIFDGIKHFFWT